MRRVLRYPVAFLAGTIAIGGFHPFEFWLFPLLSLIIIIRIALKESLSSRLLLFYFYGIGFLGPLLHWSSTYVGAIPWIILTLGFSCFYLPLAFGFLDRKLSPILFTLLFLLSEGLRAVLPFGGFGWGRFGFSQLDGPFSEWLRIGGVSLTGGVVALSAALLASFNRGSLLVLPFMLVGSLGVVPANAATTSETIRIGLIQGGVSQLGLDFNATPEEVFRRHFSETEKLLSSHAVDMVLWPENASDVDPTTTMRLRDQLDGIAEQTKTPLVIGAVTQSANGPENVSLLFDGGGGIPSRYQKRDLVPFGEYVPLRGIASLFSSLVDEVRDFVPGKEISAHRVAGIEFAPLICYEILDDRVSWENLARSDFGVVQTNNATFGRSWQSGQQFQMTRIRAFESQVPFVVAATTGDTALIDRNGQTLERLTKYESGHLVVNIQPHRAVQPLVSPEALLRLSLILIVGYFLWTLRKKFRVPSLRRD